MSFYKYLTEERRNDSVELKATMEETVSKLKKTNTDEIKPGILLGMIQSGKTRAFTGVIAKCFDEGYDLTIILTKNSVALVDQTIKRLKSEFIKPVESNRLYIWDVIKLQDGQLTGYILREKNIVIVKKEQKNMDALLELFNKIEVLNEKKILIVDDEADQAGVSFITDKKKVDGIDQGAVAKSISTLRKKLKKGASYLQVTATPYSLYLQPEKSELNLEEYAPLRPAFTVLLKPHEAYIGGEYYFEKSMDTTSPASYMHAPVEKDELLLLNFVGKTSRFDYDQRLKDNILETAKFEGFRGSILTYLVAGAIRRKQEMGVDMWSKPYHSAFLIHTSTLQKVHYAQKDLVNLLIDKLAELTKTELSEILKPYYHKLAFSIQAAKLIVPKYSEISDSLFDALKDEHIGVVEVNSVNQISELLGDDGQLRLDNPYNIFVGGQSLDRGITIDHLIGFYYGRSPGVFQMDTVLQHSRMYGSRSKEDLSVTRFYTSADIYEAMRNMYWFDKDLRDSIIKDGDKAVVKFIAKKGTQIKPCGPNKLKASCIISFKALSRMLPIGFQTRSNTDIKKSIENIDAIIEAHGKGKESFLLSGKEVLELVEIISDTFAYEPRFGNLKLDWDTAPFKKAIEVGLDKNKTNSVIIYAKSGRETARYKHQGNSFSDAPDDGKTDLPISRALAKDGPVLMLLKQKGREKDGWRDAAFYWPVLVMPANMPNYVYTEE